MGARHIFAPGLYWDRRGPRGLPLQATMVLVADAVDAIVCRRDGGGPSRDGQQASQRENVARTPDPQTHRPLAPRYDILQSAEGAPIA